MAKVAIELDWDTQDAMDVVDVVEAVVCASDRILAAIAPYKGKEAVLVVALQDVALRIDGDGLTCATRCKEWLQQHPAKEDAPDG